MDNRSFHPEKAFFVIDSDRLHNIQTKFYGFTIIDGCLINSIDRLSKKPSGDGAYIFIRRNEDNIVISQDYIGCYGIYIYRDKEYFAISNSFMYLVDYLKKEGHHLSLNREYANSFILADLCSIAYKETLANEIELIDRSVEVKINIKKKCIEYKQKDYKENTIDISSKEGLQVLDNWYYKWTKLIKSTYIGQNCIQIDLSGGFDSRLTFALVLGSGIDLNKIYIKSMNSDLHTYKEDFEIASDISRYYNFDLNNKDNLDSESFEYSLQDILDISFLLKLGTHKQMIYKTKYMNPSVIYFGGSGGECIRDYWNMNETEYIDRYLNKCKKFGQKNSKQFEASIVAILNTAIESIKNKFVSLGSPIDPEYLMINLYREIRCRNHFGRDILENYFAGMIRLCPLLDQELHKLKLSDSNCSDKNLLMAVIFDRYMPTLLKFKFEGKREIKTKTIEYAKEINKRFPRNEMVYTFNPDNHFRISLSNEKKDQFPISWDELEQLMIDIFYSSRIKHTFLQCYNNEVLEYVVRDIQSKKFLPLENAFVVIAICIIRNIEESQKIIHTACYNLLDSMDLMQVDKPTLRSHPYLDNYITSRIDIKNISARNIFRKHNNIEIISISDENVKISEPAWFQDRDRGIILTSKSGYLNILLKCIGRGQLNIALRGLDVRDKNNNRIPFVIDYYKMTYNGDEIFNEVKSLWHDSPFVLKRNVADGEYVYLSIGWGPHIENKV